MRGTALPLLALSLLFLIVLLVSPKYSQAAPAIHIVISEIQIAGSTSTDEFIELYNPTTSEISLENWELYRKTAAHDAEESLVATLSGQIPGNGFFLITHDNFDGTPSGDISYNTQNISADNSIYLKDEEGNIIDLVGMGDSETFEGSPIPAPITNRSIERKATAGSTASSMASDGSDVSFGNSEDSDNNEVDFVRHESPTTSNPQNSASTLELPPTPTISTSPTDTPTPTPTDEPSPTPTEEPTPSVTSTPTNSPTPTAEVTPTPTSSPTPTPPTPTGKVIARFTSRNYTTICTLDYTSKIVFGKEFRTPKITCEKVTSI